MDPTPETSAGDGGQWTRAGVHGHETISALSPDTIGRMEKSAPWQELCRLAEEERQSIIAKILDPKTKNKEAMKLRHALARANRIMPATLLDLLRARHS